jgi:hypothetical protein
MLEASAAAGLPSINVAPNQGKLLLLLARVMGARTILEIGTLGGYSTIWLARALPVDGRLAAKGTTASPSRSSPPTGSAYDDAAVSRRLSPRGSRVVLTRRSP